MLGDGQEYSRKKREDKKQFKKTKKGGGKKKKKKNHFTTTDFARKASISVSSLLLWFMGDEEDVEDKVGTALVLGRLYM